jgi:predicted amidohydrolase YtcJ
MYLDGERLLKIRGPQALKQMPPLVSAQTTNIHIGAGTDAHRVANYNPFVALQWMLDGKSASGIALRSEGEIPTREQALYMYTSGSAWLAHEENRRGDLKPGALADFVVLDQDFMRMPIDKISSTQSLLTVVGGKIVYHNPQAFPIPTHH